MGKDLPAEFNNGDSGANELPSTMGGAVPRSFPGGRQVQDTLFEPGADEGPNWRRYVAAVLRYKWLIVAVTIVGTAIGVVLARFQKPTFEASSTIWVEGNDSNDRNDQGPIRSGQLLDTYSWVELLKSFEVTEFVTNAQRLYLRVSNSDDSVVVASLSLMPRFNVGTFRLALDETGEEFTLSGPGYSRTFLTGDSVGTDIGFAWVPAADAMPPGTAVDFTVMSPRDAATRLGEELDARMDRDGNIMSVKLAGADPVKITETVNAVNDRYVELAAELKRQRHTELRSILDQQLEVAARNLAAREDALERFRVNTITLPTEQGTPVVPGLESTNDPVFDRFFNMKIEQEQVRRDHDVLLRVLDQARETRELSVDALEVIEAVTNSSQMQKHLEALLDARANLAALRARYTDEHPAVVRVLEQVKVLEDETIPAAVRALALELTIQDREYELRIKSAASELQQIPQRTIEEARLERAVEIAETLYTELRSRTEEARLAEASSIPDVRILDHAVEPRQPVENLAPLIMLMGFVGSLGIAVILAIVLDRIDSRVRYPEQVTHDLGLAILGAVPRANTREQGGAHDQVIESLRGIRLNLMHAHNGAWPLALTITSPGPGDGKSFVSSNLALSFAEAGHHTLLIDGDIRRGQLSRLFNVPRKPGLSDVLMGKASHEEVTHDTDFSSLRVIGCGTRTSKAPELLGSTAMSQLLDSLRGSYSVIIVDSPPLGAGIDPLALGSLTGNLALVIRTGSTDRELTEAKLDALGRLPITILGAVLNDVRPGRTGGYYGYHSYYLPGYEAEDEVEEQPAEANQAAPSG